nr:hypothetical protein [Tanacetum cinerariifolium]
RRVEDLQLGVESYQKKLNLTKSDSYRSELKHKEAYTVYSNPQGFIYQNKDKRNRLMWIDELHKFSDGTLTDVRTALDDRLKGKRMQYLPQSIWRKSEKDRAATMIQAINKRLKTRRIMRSLERITEVDKETYSTPKEKRVHWCKAILQEKENEHQYWASCDPNSSVCDGGGLPINEEKCYWQSINDSKQEELEWEELSLNDWMKIRHGKVCKMNRGEFSKIIREKSSERKKMILRRTQKTQRNAKKKKKHNNRGYS